MPPSERKGGASACGCWEKNAQKQCLHCSEQRNEAVLTAPAVACDRRTWNERLPSVRVTEDVVLLTNPAAGYGWEGGLDTSVRVGRGDFEMTNGNVSVGGGGSSLGLFATADGNDDDESGVPASILLRTGEPWAPNTLIHMRDFDDDYQSPAVRINSAANGESITGGGSSSLALAGSGAFSLGGTRTDGEPIDAEIYSDGTSMTVDANASLTLRGAESATLEGDQTTVSGFTLLSLSAGDTLGLLAQKTLSASALEGGATLTAQTDLILTGNGTATLEGANTATVQGNTVRVVGGSQLNLLSDANLDLLAQQALVASAVTSASLTAGTDLTLRATAGTTGIYGSTVSVNAPGGNATTQAGNVVVLGSETVNVTAGNTLNLFSNKLLTSSEDLSVTTANSLTVTSANLASVNAPTVAINAGNIGFFTQPPVPQQGAGGVYTHDQVVDALKAYGLLKA